MKSIGMSFTSQGVSSIADCAEPTLVQITCATGVGGKRDPFQLSLSLDFLISHATVSLDPTVSLEQKGGSLERSAKHRACKTRGGPPWPPMSEAVHCCTLLISSSISMDSSALSDLSLLFSHSKRMIVRYQASWWHIVHFNTQTRKKVCRQGPWFLSQ